MVKMELSLCVTDPSIRYKNTFYFDLSPRLLPFSISFEALAGSLVALLALLLVLLLELFPDVLKLVFPADPPPVLAGLVGVAPAAGLLALVLGLLDIAVDETTDLDRVDFSRLAVADLSGHQEGRLVSFPNSCTLEYSYFTAGLHYL